MDTINWDDIYLQLYAYTDQLLKAKSWFRKGKIDSYLKGKQVHDYISEAIEKYLTAPEKYDSSFGRSLINYLKKHIIRSLVSNDAKSIENVTSSDALSLQYSDNDDEPFYNVDALLPFVAPFFEQEIDYKDILKDIHSELQQDETAKIIFEEVRCNRLNRRDVLALYKMEETEFDYGMKRLKTILKNTAIKYQVIKEL